MSNSQFITTTRLISFPQIRTVLRVIGPNFQTKDFSPFTFFTLDPCVCFGLLESKKTCTLKSSLKGKKKWCFLPLSLVKIKSTQPHLHVFSVIITVFFLFIFFLILLAAFFLLGDFLYAPHFHFIIIIIFIWVCLKSCFLSVNLWDKWIGILVGLFKIRGCLFVDFSFAFSKLHIVLVDH